MKEKVQDGSQLSAGAGAEVLHILPWLRKRPSVQVPLPVPSLH